MIKSLEEIAVIKMGKNLSVKNLLPNGYPVFGANGQIGFYSEYMFEEPVVAVSCRGAKSGVVNYTLPNSFVTNNSITVVPKEKNLFDSKFMFYILTAKILSRIVSGSAQPQIIVGDLARVKIFLPPVPEQKRIVDILEKADILLKKRQEANDLSNKTTKAIFLKMFGDVHNNFKGIKKQKIEEVISKCERRDPSKQPNITFKYVDIAGVNGENGIIEASKEMMGKYAPSRARQIIHTNDVIISTVRPNLRSTALVPDFLDDQICSTGFCVLRPSERIKHYYLYEISRMEWFTSILVSKVRGASYPAVTDKDILGVEIPVPAISEQQKFANFVKKVEKIKEKQHVSKQELNNLFNSLMQRAFS